MSLGYIVIDGRSSQEFGVYTTDAGVYDRPEREIEKYEIPGQSGDLIIDKNRFKNIDVRYPGFIVDDFEKRYNDFFSYLLSLGRYFRLEDSFKPEEYRQAYFTAPLIPTNADKKKGTFEIVVHAKPQRFLKEGDRPITIYSDATIKNPTLLPSKPLVRVYGTGSVVIAGITITILAAEGYTDFDCLTQMAYKDSMNCNSNIVLEDDKFWELPVGEASISLGSRISRIELTPRWYII